MAVLSAVFKGFDEISSIFDKMAYSGASAVDTWEEVGTKIDSSLAHAANIAEKAANAAEKAASSTNTWTEALGNFDKGTLEANHSTAELVEMGYKSQAAFEAERESMSLCAEAGDFLTKSIKSAATSQSEMIQVNEEASKIAEKIAENDKVSTETKNNLIGAIERHNQAVSEMAQIGNEAVRASEEFTKAINTEGISQEDLSKAAMSAANATEKLIDANHNATETAKELSTASERASEEHEKSGKSGVDAFKSIEQALVAAGLTKLISDVTDAVIDMTNAFSEAESIIVKATGATGTQLDSLNASMMKVYADIDDANLSNTAAAIGELNTRLGLQGDELEKNATLFMQYADNTNTGVVSSVQNVTKVMKNWNIEVNETESLLDKLTYAGQASGASVSNLSDMVVTNKATLQQLGYGLDESIALLSMFEYEGLNASSIMTGFRTAVNNFSNEGKDASAAMQEIITEIGSMASESEATALAVETFGSRAGSELAFAIRNSKFEIDDWINAIGNAEGTLAKTDEAADTLADKWTQATNKVSAAFINVLEPTTSRISNVFVNLVGGIGDFLNKYPAVTAALTGVGVALGVIAVSFAAYTAATTIATAVTSAFGAASLAALWPLGLIAAAIGVVVAVSIGLSNSISDAEKEYNSLSATSKKHYDQLQDLNQEYECTVKRLGETSEEAEKLAADIAGLEAVYESTKMTIEEFSAQNKALSESCDKLISSYRASSIEIEREEKNSIALINKLEELSSKTQLTTTEQELMSVIVDKLNGQLPDLALSYDKVTGVLNKSIFSMKSLAEEEAKRRKQTINYDNYVELYMKQNELMEQIAIAQNNIAAAEERMSKSSGWNTIGKEINEYKAELYGLQVTLGEVNYELEKNENAFEESVKTVEAAANTITSYKTAVNEAISSVSQEVNNLAEEYYKAYDSAYDSISSQMGLFGDMTAAAERYAEENAMSIGSMLQSWQSQADYMEEYMSNLERVRELNLSENIISHLLDGSEESAAALKTIANSGESYINQLNEAFAKVEIGKENFSFKTIETEFSDAWENIETRITDAIEKMNMEENAKGAARSTIWAYIEQIRSMAYEAGTAADAVAKATEDALSKNLSLNTIRVQNYGIIENTSMPEALFSFNYEPNNFNGPIDWRNNLDGITGYASGTNYATQGLAIVGEKGPELIDFGGGETVYDADETNKIFSSARGSNEIIYIPTVNETTSIEERKTSIEKKIVIDINGNGELDISGGINKDEVVAILFEYVKPALMKILMQEVFEEGDGTYDF